MSLTISFYRHEGPIMLETQLEKPEALRPDLVTIKLFLHVAGVAEKVQIVSCTVLPHEIMPIAGDSPTATTFGLLCNAHEKATAYWTLKDRAQVQHSMKWLKDNYNV